ncbi:MAG: hypothetical protein ABWZ85_14595, partial [Luteibacter sp.]
GVAVTPFARKRASHKGPLVDQRWWVGLPHSPLRRLSPTELAPTGQAAACPKAEGMVCERWYEPALLANPQSTQGE